MNKINTFEKIVLFILVNAVSCWTLTSCEKINVPKDTPRCMKKMIKEENDGGCASKITRYNYNGETVYLVSPDDNRCSDGGYYVYDDDCNHICTPKGTIFGIKEDARCPDFFILATDSVGIWIRE